MIQSGLNRRFPPAVETAAYRIVQEALTNVARHARVRAVTVRLWGSHENLGVQVEDQGVGFDPNGKPVDKTSSGLTGIRERVRLLGGSLTLTAAPGAGTELTAFLPLGESSGEGGDGNDDHNAGR